MADGVSQGPVSLSSLRRLAEWSFDDPTVVPDAVVQQGPGAIVEWASKEAADSAGEGFWAATSPAMGQEGEPEAVQRLAAFHVEENWRHGWAIASLRALIGQPLSYPGRFVAIGYVRMRLLFQSTLREYRNSEDGRLPPAEQTYAVSPESSPFGDPTVQEVLRAMDAIISDQEASPSRIEAVIVDMGLCSTPHLRWGYDYLKQEILSDYLGPPPRPFGGFLSERLRFLSERAEAAGEIDLLMRLSDPVWLCPARYGTTADYLMGVHRHLRSIIESSPDRRGENIVLVLDHARVAAEWLGDAEVEAALNHALFFLMRAFVRKAPGVFDGVAYIQRAILLRHQLGQTIRALGAQIDMTSLLIQWGPLVAIGVAGRRTPAEIADWEHAAESYLGDAIARLAAFPESMEALEYMGEAYHNRACLYQRLERADDAKRDALACVALAEKTGATGLLIGGRMILGAVVDDPETALEAGITAVRLLQDIRKRVERDETAVSWIQDKEAVFDTSLHAILSSSRTTLSEERACQLLLTSLEVGRGLTYNRWVGHDPVDDLADLQKMLAADESAPVLAVVAVAYDRVGLMILDGDRPPRLQGIAMTAAEARNLALGHLRGLDYHRRLPGRTLWSGLQPGFATEGWKLVEPLEPYVAEGRPLCIVPHRVLHSVAFHLLPTRPDGVPIGLRTPVFQNPNVTNWITARRTDRAGFAPRALVAHTAPEAELDDFDEAGAVATILSEAGVPVIAPPPERTSPEALASRGGAWLVLHLGCHGIFRPTGLTGRNVPDIGLLLARDGVLPPLFGLGEDIGDLMRGHVATPAGLRSACIGARLAFLASCVSARSEEYAGDDLLGITRALFAGGTVDLVAGAWTVVSSIASEFVGSFYGALAKNARTADAMLVARKAVAREHPDPFHWGVFMHMGANAQILEARR